MKKIERRAVICMILALVLVAGMALFVLKYVIDGGTWASSAFNRHLYDTNGVLVTGTILDRDGDILSEIQDGKRVYYEDSTVRKATLHAVGDLQGNIGTGALHAFGDRLSGYDLINGAFGSKQGNELYLTIDARYHYEAYRALNGQAGTVAVYNYKTGEVLCMVSTPSYDPVAVPENIAEDDAYRGAYLNRFLSSVFTPGSVFKTVTLAAALENLQDAEERIWLCEGSAQVGEETIVCAGKHGEQTIGEAFSNSCNVAFAQMAAELGAETLASYTRQAGLTDSYTVSGIPTAKGTFEWENISEGELGWAGVGQHKDLLNPCGLMVYMGAIANGGKAAQPCLIQKTVSPLGISSRESGGQRTKKLIQKDTAALLTQIMAEAVEATYGTERFPNMELCAKSGTAEVGADQKPHSWFAGFLRNEETPYAFVVLVENGGSGNAVAGTVAGKVLNIMVNGY